MEEFCGAVWCGVVVLAASHSLRCTHSAAITNRHTMPSHRPRLSDLTEHMRAVGLRQAHADMADGLLLSSRSRCHAGFSHTLHLVYMK